VKALGLQEGSYSTSFQSRLGRDPWIKPYTDHVFEELRKKGVKRLAVMCPAFVADCLETLEEIGMRGVEDWRKLGGEKLELIPSLNAEDPWCRTVADMLR
jgi:ferrochelatase